LDTQSRIAYARQEGRLEILELIDSGYTPEQIRERLKTGNGE
jgi:hypothetical protein